MRQPRPPGLPAPTREEDLMPAVRALIEAVKALRDQVTTLSLRVDKLEQ